MYLSGIWSQGLMHDSICSKLFSADRFLLLSWVETKSSFASWSQSIWLASGIAKL